MSYETTNQKKLLAKLQDISSQCSAEGIHYGKAYTSFNLGYGKQRPERDEAASKVKENNLASAKRAKAEILSRLTGLQVRLAKQLPEEMSAKIADDQMVGEVFSLTELEAILV